MGRRILSHPSFPKSVKSRIGDKWRFRHQIHPTVGANRLNLQASEDPVIVKTDYLRKLLKIAQSENWDITAKLISQTIERTKNETF